MFNFLQLLKILFSFISRAMRNMSIDPQVAQQKAAAVAAAAAHASTSTAPTGLSAELAAEMATGGSLLQHFPGFADAAQLRQWSSDPTSAMAAAAAANYMQMGSSLASAYNQATMRDLAATTGGTGLDFLSQSFPPASWPAGEEDDLNDDLIDDDFEREERRQISASPPTSTGSEERLAKDNQPRGEDLRGENDDRQGDNQQRDQVRDTNDQGEQPENQVDA